MDRYLRNRILAIIAFTAIIMPATAYAAQQLSIRMVEADNQSEYIDASLSDVSSVLRRNLPYKRFRMLGHGNSALPTGGNTSFPNGYSLIVSGPAANCAVKILKNNKPLLTTSVSLRGNTPLIVGGFPAGAGKHLFILNLR